MPTAVRPAMTAAAWTTFVCRWGASGAGGGGDHRRQPDDDVDLRAALPQPAHGLEHDEPAADGDDGRRHGGGDALDLAVAVGVVLVGGPDRHAHADQSGRAPHEVGGAVDGVGQDGDAAADDAQGQLQRQQAYGGTEGDRRYSYRSGHLTWRDGFGPRPAKRPCAPSPRVPPARWPAG